MSTIHTSLVGRRVSLVDGSKGEIVAAYLANTTIPYFLILLDAPSKAGRPLIEVEWHKVQTVLNPPKRPKEPPPALRPPKGAQFDP